MPKEVKPRKIRLEASSICQLKCPSCPNTSRAIQPTIGSGFLKLSDFCNLIDQNPWIREIELSNYGEIFLNPHLLEIIEYAHDKQIVLRADNGVNLNHVKEDVLAGLVKCSFRSMSCSLDGASSKTYSQYRVNGEFEPIKRAHSPQLAAGLASVYKISIIPYGRRFPAACCRVFNRLLRTSGRLMRLNADITRGILCCNGNSWSLDSMNTKYQ
jgi:molybdenum cofactor biosynthesis enzyme MoaA